MNYQYLYLTFLALNITLYIMALEKPMLRWLAGLLLVWACSLMIMLIKQREETEETRGVVMEEWHKRCEKQAELELMKDGFLK